MNMKYSSLSKKSGIIPTTKYMNKVHRYKNASGNLVTNWARGGAKANMYR